MSDSDSRSEEVLSILELDVRDQILDIDEKGLLCDSEEDLQKALNEPQVEVEGDHLKNMQLYVRKQLSPLSVTTNVDAAVRANIVDAMLTSSDLDHCPLASHLAIQVFDRYFVSYVESELVNALSPDTVASTATTLAIKHLYGVKVDATQKIHRTEFEILNRLHYELNAPTLKKLVDAALHSTAPHPSKLLPLCSYLTDLALLDRDCLGFPITVLAAGCLFLGQFILDSTNRVRALWECDAQHLRDAVTILHELFLKRRLPQCRAIRSKYSSLLFAEVADLPCSVTIPDDDVYF